MSEDAPTPVVQKVAEIREQVGERLSQAVDVGRLALSAAGVKVAEIREQVGERLLDKAADRHAEAVSTQKTIRSIGMEAMLSAGIYNRAGHSAPDRESSNLVTRFKDWRVRRKVDQYQDAKVHAKKQKSARGPITDIRRTRSTRLRNKVRAGIDVITGNSDAASARRRMREADRTIVTKVDRTTTRSMSKESKKQERVDEYSRKIMRKAHTKTERAENRVRRRGRQQARKRNALARKRAEHEELRRELAS